MILDVNGSISLACATAAGDEVAEILQTRLQEKQNELLSWVNEWHMVDLHALLFVLEVTTTALRSQMKPSDERMLQRLHKEFCTITGAVPVLKRKEADDEA